MYVNVLFFQKEPVRDRDLCSGDVKISKLDF